VFIMAMRWQTDLGEGAYIGRGGRRGSEEGGRARRAPVTCRGLRLAVGRGPWGAAAGHGSTTAAPVTTSTGEHASRTTTALLRAY